MEDGQSFRGGLGVSFIEVINLPPNLTYPAYGPTETKFLQWYWALTTNQPNLHVNLARGFETYTEHAFLLVAY